MRLIQAGSCWNEITEMAMKQKLGKGETKPLNGSVSILQDISSNFRNCCWIIYADNDGGLTMGAFATVCDDSSTLTDLPRRIMVNASPNVFTPSSVKSARSTSFNKILFTKVLGVNGSWFRCNACLRKYVGPHAEIHYEEPWFSWILSAAPWRSTTETYVQWQRASSLFLKRILRLLHSQRNKRQGNTSRGLTLNQHKAT